MEKFGGLCDGNTGKRDTYWFWIKYMKFHETEFEMSLEKQVFQIMKM